MALMGKNGRFYTINLLSQPNENNQWEDTNSRVDTNFVYKFLKRMVAREVCNQTAERDWNQQ